MGRYTIFRYSSFMFVIIIFSCKSESRIDDDTLSFDKVNGIIPKGDMLYASPTLSWRHNEGNAKIDRDNLYMDKMSLAITPDTSGRSHVFFLVETREVEMKEVVFSGKYKVVPENEEGNINFCIFYFDKGEKKGDTICIIPHDTLWSDFRIRSFVNSCSDLISFDILSKDSIFFSVSDCKVTIDGQPLSQVLNKKYDAELDKEFDKGSQIDLGEELTMQKIENLEVLGKVWGFMKYYHPEVIQGKYNWDYELFRVMPQITNAKNREERNKLLNKWIDSYGKIKKTTDYTINDSSKYARFVNLNWINDSYILDNKLIKKLDKIKNAKRNDRFNYYVVPYKANFNHVDFDREKKYKNIKWDDQGFRILTLFKLWNVIEYCFPYTCYTDIPWEILLKEFIPAFYNPGSKTEYELSLLKLAAHIQDSHGYVHIPDNDLNNMPISPLPYIYDYKVPIELIETVEGFIAVKTSNSPFFHKGDIICSINNVCIDTIKAELQPYIITSNRKGFIRKLMFSLLQTETANRSIGILRDGKKIEIKLTKPEEFSSNINVKVRSKVISNSSNIIYLNTLDNINEIDRIMRNSFNTKGLIIDMREGASSMETLYGIGDYLSFLEDDAYPLWISNNEKEFPGRFKQHFASGGIGFNVSPKYDGKVVILVNENNQSAYETWPMLYRLSTNSVIIGTQTAGANGNIASVNLPGGIKFTYTGLGAYYPNWEQLQRVGVKIDIPIFPTIQDIKEGRDVWVERAIEYINYK